MATTGDGKFRNVSFGPVSRHQVQKASTSRQSPYAEIGRTGLRQWGGYVMEDFLSELQGRRAAEMFKEMGDNDPILSAMLYSAEMLVRKVEWWVEPASEDGSDVESQELVQDILFNDLDTAWSDVVSEIMSMLQYGYHVCETVYKKRPDGRIGLKKLATRAQDSLLKWEFEEGTDEVLAFVQQPPPSYGTYTIPFEKMLLFRTKIHKGNPEGRSVFRACVKAYAFKKSLEALRGIGIERDLAGLPVLTPPDGVDLWNANDPAMVQLLAQAQAMVSQVRRDEMEGVVKPSGWEFEPFKNGGPRQIDVNQAINYYDQRMAMSMLADMITLGADKVGSYALAGAKKDLYSAALECYLDSIASVFNTHLIPRLGKLNGFDWPNGAPKLSHGPVQEISLDQIAAMLTALGTSGAPVFTGDMEDKLLTALFDRMGLPSPVSDETSEGE